MDLTYKQFNIANTAYMFCIEDFEVFKIHQVENVEKVLQIIKKRKEKFDSNVDTNKKGKLKDVFNSKSINTIGIDLANGCTLNCTYCYISASNRPRKMLSKEVFLDILTFLKNAKDNSIAFYFTGAGEPTLNFKLLKQIPYLCKKNGFDNCAFDLTTNGTILTTEMIEFFKMNKFTIYISLDGINFNDKNSGNKSHYI